MFRKVLVANRGEIAVRIIRTLREMGIPSVAVYSDPDRDALHVRLAEEAYPLVGSTSGETYLGSSKLLEIARQSGTEAVHPGYGFLSENADFAAAVEAAGLAFVGPSPDAMRALGDKIEAKHRMEAAGVPVLPGWSGSLDSANEARAAAEAVGYPLLVKAAAGGGGKGMRLVEAPEELEAAVESAGREAEKAFGDGRIFLERYLRRPRHVEVQVFGDAQGGAVHLFERECSIQRRHQKIVEESPSPGVDAELRARIGEAAVRAARAVGYRNAGTVEFLLDEDGNFYFMEVNARLQVEHPVTELVTGRDLVRAQLLVAAGEPLPYAQDELEQRGHALECRVYAEDPDNHFLPSTGRLHVYREPTGPGIRVDSGVREGDQVTIHYDPLLAKVIVHAETRQLALDRMDRALADFVLLGVRTNIPFLRLLVGHPAFRAGDLHTGFLEEHPLKRPASALPDAALAAAALALLCQGPQLPEGRRARAASPWLDGGGWRLR